MSRSCLIAALLLAGCEREAPSCDTVARHALEHIHARPFMADADRVRLRIRLPFSVELTEEDAAHVATECAGWSADYRNCIVDNRGSGFHCGPEDIVWSTLPHVKRWLDDLAGRAAEAYWIARERVTAADLEVERLMTDAALYERISTAGPRDMPVGSPIRDQLEKARGIQRQARELAAACELRPLEQEACVALLP